MYALCVMGSMCKACAAVGKVRMIASFLQVIGFLPFEQQHLEAHYGFPPVPTFFYAAACAVPDLKQKQLTVAGD